MFKKLAVIIFMAAFAFNFSSCKKGENKQQAAEENLKKMSELMDATAAKINAAEDAATVAAALNEFADECAKSSCDKSKKDPQCEAKCKEFDEKIKSQIEQYKDDPEVVKALERLGKKCEAKEVKEAK